MSGMHSHENYIFYMSDFSSVSGDTRCGKMNADYEIIRQLEKNLHNCTILKYTDYNGEKIHAKSVGIVFPSHTWGISLAVYTFLQNLNVSVDTYVYALTMGACMSGDVDFTVNTRTQNLNEFVKIFIKKKMGDYSHIFVRCIDYKRASTTVEEKIRQTSSVREQVENILESLLFYNLDVILSKRISSVKEADKAHWKSLAAGEVEQAKNSNNKRKTSSRIDNVFLDDDILAGVRLCRVI